MRLIWCFIFLIICAPAWALPLTTSVTTSLITYPTQAEVKQKVLQLFHDHENGILKDVQASQRWKAWIIEDVELMNQLTLCGHMSQTLAYYLIQDGYDVWINRAAGHVTIGMMAQEEGGLPYELLIDPTWRQIFNIPWVLQVPGRFGGEEFNQTMIKDLFNMARLPEILVIPKKMIKDFYQNIGQMKYLLPVRRVWYLSMLGVTQIYPAWQAVTLYPVWQVEEKYLELKNIARLRKELKHLPRLRKLKDNHSFDSYYKTIRQQSGSTILTLTRKFNSLKAQQQKELSLSHWVISQYIMNKRSSFILSNPSYHQHYLTVLKKKGLLFPENYDLVLKLVGLTNSHYLMRQLNQSLESTETSDEQAKTIWTSYIRSLKAQATMMALYPKHNN